MPTVNILALLVLLLPLLFTLCSTQTAPAPAPVPPADGPFTSVKCLQSVGNASDCFSYVKVESTETKPESACCPEPESGLVQNAPECVCHLLNGGESPHFGVTFDKQRGEKLSSICGVKAPPPSSCSDLDFPTFSPPEYSSGSEGKKTSGMTTKDYGVALNTLMLALFMICS